MKKNSFLEGTIISTVGIILCKVIGLIYVVPFYAIIGREGGILYNYAYTIYGVFLSLSASGIPIAISKIVSEYNALGYYNTKERAFKIGSLIITIIGVLCFLVLFIFAPQVAYLIIGDLEGGNSIESISMVIRVISTAILIVPILSVYRGYIQGHRIMTVPSFANVIEQLVRVFVIIFGSFMALRVLNLSLDTAVGISVFGATVGAIVAYIYVFAKIRKEKDKLNRDALMSREESKITKKDIFRKIMFYAIPFIIIDVIKSAYSMVDTFTVVRTLNKIGYDAITAESVLSNINTWASKLNMIIISIAIGMTVSLIPNISGSFVKKDLKDVNRKINQALQLILFIVLPMTMGLNMIASPVWTIFYGYDNLGIMLFGVYVFQALSYSFYSILIDTTQTMNNTKVALGTLLGSLVLKLLFNIPMMYLFNIVGIEAYYAPIITTIVIQFIAIIFLLVMLNKMYQVNYKDTFNKFVKIILATAIMYVSLMIVKIFVPIDSASRSKAIIETIIFGFVGGIVYLFVVFKTKLIYEIFGFTFINNILVKLKIKKNNN